METTKISIDQARVRVEAKLVGFTPETKAELMKKNFEDAYRMYSTVKSMYEYVLANY